MLVQILLRAGQLLVVLVLLYFLVTVAARGLRRGKYQLRGGMVITRRHQPFQFWVGIALSLIFACIIVWVYARCRSRIRCFRSEQAGQTLGTGGQKALRDSPAMAADVFDRYGR